MSTQITASQYFPRRESGSIAHFALIAAAAGMTAIIWLAMAGAGDQARGYKYDNLAEAARHTLPRVEVIANRDAISRADAAEITGGAVDRNTHKPA